jgi:predicted component of type VI protein secretion system
MPYIEFEHQTRSLGPGVLIIGSGTEAGWRILGRDLAPVHAVVTVERGGYALFVSGAPEAVIHVNGEEVADGRASVRYGDRVRLGKAEFRYLQLARGNDGRGGYLREMRRGRSYHLGDFTEIGRDPKCGVFIPEPEVSRIHAEIRRENGHFVVVPRNALTLRNGERITAGVPLTEGDELSIGRTTLRFSAEPTGQTVEAAASPTHRPGDSRRMQMPTTFMGAYEAAERVNQIGRRRLVAMVAAAAALAISIGALLAR